MTFYSIPFVQFFVPGVSVPFLTPKITDWQEHIVWQGGQPERTLSGELIDSRHTPKREWDATIILKNNSEYELFLSYISTAIDANTGLQLGLKTIGMYGIAGDSAFHSLASRQILVLVDIASSQPFEYEEARFGKIGWQCEVTIREV